MGRRSIEEIRKEEIITALFRVISEKGLGGASMREIAAAAGCSHGILRHYFGSREGLIKGAVDFLMDEYLADFQEGMSKVDSSINQIRQLFQVFSVGRFDIDLSRSWIEIYVFSQTNATISKAFREFYEKIKDNIESIIRKGIELGEFRRIDPTVTANMIIAGLEGTLYLTVVDADHTPYELMNQQFGDMFLDYLVRSPDADNLDIA